MFFVLIGPGIALVGILGMIFLSHFFVVLFIGLVALGPVFTILGVRTIAAAKHAAVSTA